MLELTRTNFVLLACGEVKTKHFYWTIIKRLWQLLCCVGPVQS